jgi:hypothetical protein
LKGVSEKFPHATFEVKAPAASSSSNSCGKMFRKRSALYRCEKSVPKGADCVGVKKYVDNQPKLAKMTVGLYSQCMGGNSQYEAIARHPELFKNVKCMCSPLVPSMSAIFQAFSELQGVAQYQELIDLELLKMGPFPAADMTPHSLRRKLPCLI